MDAFFSFRCGLNMVIVFFFNLNPNSRVIITLEPTFGVYKINYYANLILLLKSSPILPTDGHVRVKKFCKFL